MSRKDHIKKNINWYLLLVFLLFFVVLPTVAITIAAPASYYLRIFFALSFWGFLFSFSLYGILAPKDVYFRKKANETKPKKIQIVSLSLFRFVFVIALMGSLFYGTPILRGVILKYIFKQPYEALFY